MGVGGQHHAPAALPPGKTRYLLYRRLGGPQGRPARSELLYRLSYPGPWTLVLAVFNLLKPTGYVMHQQFNIQQLYALPTLYLCVLYLSENKQRLALLTA